MKDGIGTALHSHSLGGDTDKSIIDETSTNLVEANYVRMTEQLHHLDFTKDLLEIVDIELRFVDDLDRHLANEQHNIASAGGANGDIK